MIIALERKRERQFLSSEINGWFTGANNMRKDSEVCEGLELKYMRLRMKPTPSPDEIQAQEGTYIRNTMTLKVVISTPGQGFCVATGKATKEPVPIGPKLNNLKRKMSRRTNDDCIMM